MPLRFNMLLQDAGIDLREVRLLRHQTNMIRGRTPYTLWRDDPRAFETYQSVQDVRQRSRFSGRFWASFVVPPNGSTLFVGLYEVERDGLAPAAMIDPLSGGLVGERKGHCPYDQYRCTKVAALSEYAGRLFVKWGDSASASRAWAQRADRQDKEIVELGRKFQEEAFAGFTKLIRPLSEIEAMPASWKEILRAARGVYLLACPRTREHYVGSASGAEGFLGRWTQYATNSHGGNVGLRIRDPSDYVVSILETVGSAASVEDILALEASWKEKLQSRSIGLNRN